MNLLKKICRPFLCEVLIPFALIENIFATMVANMLALKDNGENFFR